MNPPAGVTAPSGGFQNGGWYGGQQYVNGTWSAPGQINSQSNQQGAGQQVSKAVVAQTNPNNVAYLDRQNGGQTSNPTNGSSSSGASGMSGMGSGAPAIPNLQGVYDQYYTNNPDVAAANKSITDLQGQITTRQQALDTATKGINDNPFYAEATRVGKVAQLNNDAQNDINTLTGQLNTAQTNLTNLQAEAQRQVNMSTGQYTLNNQAYQQNLQEFNTLLSAGGLENASPSTLSQLSVSTGISPDMLSSIQQSEQSKNTQILTSTDNSGNVTYTAVNSQTGKVINSETLGGVGKGSGGGSGKGTSTGTKAGDTAQTYQNLLQDVQNGVTLKSLVSHYGVPGGLTTEQVYQAYGNFSPNGAPKETLSQVKSGQYADMAGFVSKTKPAINSN